MPGRWLRLLDHTGMNDPDNDEGSPEGLCTICDRRIVDHPGHEFDGIGNRSTKWPHRRAVLGLILGRT